MFDQSNSSYNSSPRKTKSIQNSIEKDAILREKKTEKDKLLSPGKSKKNRSTPSSPTINLLRETSDTFLKGDGAGIDMIRREEKTEKDKLLSPGKSKKNRSISSNPTINLMKGITGKLVKRERTVTFGNYISFDEELDFNTRNVRFE